MRISVVSRKGDPVYNWNKVMGIRGAGSQGIEAGVGPLLIR